MCTDILIRVGCLRRQKTSVHLGPNSGLSLIIPSLVKRHSPAFIVPKGVFFEAGSPGNRNALLVSFFSPRAFCLRALPTARKLRPTFKLRYVRSIDFIVLRQKTLASMACGQIARRDGVLLVFFLGIVGGKIRAGVKSSDRLGRPI